MKLICLGLLTVVGAILSARAEQFRTDINPALTYYQALLLAPALPGADLNYLYNHEHSGQKLPEHFGDIVAQYDDELKLCRQAAHAQVPCDWGIDMSSGPATLLPQLGRLKQAAVAAVRFRAVWDLQKGREAEARDNLIAAFVLGRNISRNGPVISEMVQNAVEATVCSTVAENFYQFSPETLKQLVEGFEAAPARGTVSGSLTTGERALRDGMLNRVERLKKENLGNDAKVMGAVRDLCVSTVDSQAGSNFWARLAKAAGGTSDGVVELVQDEGRLYQRLAVIMALPYPEYENQIKQFSAEIQKSQNPLVSERFPSLQKSRTKELAIVVELAMVRAAVEYKLHGESGLQRVIDPCGQGPFTIERFAFEGVDRGFELKSAFDGLGFPYVLIFVEKAGPPFYVSGNSVVGKKAGEPLPKADNRQ